MKKNKFKLISIVSVALVAVIIFIGFQGCSKEENAVKEHDSSVMSSLKVKKIQKTAEFTNFVSVYNQYQKETFAAINSMSAEERDHFMKNMNDDNVMKAFIEKYNLKESNINLQKQIQILRKNSNFNELTYNEKVDLFKKGQFSNPVKKNVTGRLKTTGQETIGEEPCFKAYNAALTELNLKTSLALVQCVCAIEVPLVACICAAAAMANHYIELNKLEKAYQTCLANKPK